MNGTLQSGTQTYRWTQVLPATILLVEDEATVREVTREVLEMSCYHVLTADGAMAAAHIAGDEATAIDLLLTDVVMPGINGVELARQIRELRPELATLFMTGYAEGEFLRVAALGAQQKHIKKPFTVSSLLAGVADALAARWNISNRNLNPQYPSPLVSPPPRPRCRQTARLAGSGAPRPSESCASARSFNDRSGSQPRLLSAITPVDTGESQSLKNRFFRRLLRD